MLAHVSHGEYVDGTDKQTDGRMPDISLRFPLDAVSEKCAVCRIFGRH